MNVPIRFYPFRTYELQKAHPRVKKTWRTYKLLAPPQKGAPIRSFILMLVEEYENQWLISLSSLYYPQKRILELIYFDE